MIAAIQGSTPQPLKAAPANQVKLTHAEQLTAFWDDLDKSQQAWNHAPSLVPDMVGLYRSQFRGAHTWTLGLLGSATVPAVWYCKRCGAIGNADHQHGPCPASYRALPAHHVVES